MLFRSLVVALASLPALALAGDSFNGNYSVSVGPGPVGDFYILSVMGAKGTLKIAKPFQQPSAPVPVKIEQTSDKMTVILASDASKTLRFVKSQKGLTCASGCIPYAVNWNTEKTAEEVKLQNKNPANVVDFDSLAVAPLGNIDGTWVLSRKNVESDTDLAFEVKSDQVRLDYFLFGFYQKTSSKHLQISGDAFVYKGTNNKFFDLRKIDDTRLVARSPQSKELAFLYRANSINYPDLKKALIAADPRMSSR